MGIFWEVWVGGSVRLVFDSVWWVCHWLELGLEKRDVLIWEKVLRYVLLRLNRIESFRLGE